MAFQAMLPLLIISLMIYTTQSNIDIICGACPINYVVKQRGVGFIPVKTAAQSRRIG